VASGALLSGCGSSTDGLSGVTQGVDGGPVARYLSCDHVLVSAHLLDADPADGPVVELGRWNPDEPSAAPPPLSLRGEPENWRTGRPWVVESGQLTLIAYSQNSTSSTRPVSFTLADVAALESGQVLTADGVQESDAFDAWCQGND